jgi:hypothetical protein
MKVMRELRRSDRGSTSHLYGSLIIESSAFSPCSIVEGYSCLRAPDPVATRTWESCARFVSTR